MRANSIVGAAQTLKAAGTGLTNRFWITAIFIAAMFMPLTDDNYFGLIATRAAIYWILVAGLNLVIGYAGQLAIGYVSLLTVGAYTASLLVARLSLDVPLALVVAGGAGAVFGVFVGLPALRLKTFYFAIVTFGFATIVTQIALGWTSLTGGGTGVAGPPMPGYLGTTWGLYFFCLALAALATWFTVNVGESHYGRALIALRDAEVAAEANGISKTRLLIFIFLLSGVLAGAAGGLFASVQTYITPDAFTFDLSLLFFIAILVGGQGSILGPLLGTMLLTVLPEVALPLATWSTFLYAVLLLLVVLAVPGGIAELLDFRSRSPLASARLIVPDPSGLNSVSRPESGRRLLSVREVHLQFGSVVAITDLDLGVATGMVHGLIGPNGSGKTTTLNVISGFLTPQRGSVSVDGLPLRMGAPQTRAHHGIARTFQTPRIVRAISVLDNVLIGGNELAKTGFLSAMAAMPWQRREEADLRSRALEVLTVVGLRSLATVRASRLQHSELRFVEIARALMISPDFLLLDEPAAGLSAEEIRELGKLVRAIAESGTGVLLVEHHADFIFSICDTVTVLNMGRVLASGRPDEIRSHKEVISAYLGTSVPGLPAEADRRQRGL